LIEITFKLTEMNGEYEGVCLNPKDIPPDDMDDVILGRMIVTQPPRSSPTVKLRFL
jgi:hypothetical protein